jgi:hypothetical protein
MSDVYNFTVHIIIPLLQGRRAPTVHTVWGLELARPTRMARSL